MTCWICTKTAQGTCRFCGRAICKEHAKTKAFILSLYTSLEVPKAIVVSNTLFCDQCKPQPNPIELPELR